MSSPSFCEPTDNLPRHESHPLVISYNPRQHEWGSLFWRKYLLNTDLIDQMLSPQIGQMCPFLVIR
jgi:hypothetical protein